MVAVKDLMVGIDAKLQIQVAETGVQRMLHRRESQISVDFLENVVQAFCLLQVIGRNVDVVTCFHALGKRLSQQIKVFVEQRLHCRLKSQLRPLRFFGPTAQHDALKSGYSLLSFFAAHQQQLSAQLRRFLPLFLLRARGLSLLHEGLFRETFVINAADDVCYIRGILHHQQRFLRQEVEKRLTAARQCLFHLGNDVNFVFSFFRQLGIDTKSADRVYFVAKEVYSVRIFT